LKQQDIEKLLTHLKEKYGFDRDLGYQIIIDIIMNIIIHQNPITKSQE